MSRRRTGKGFCPYSPSCFSCPAADCRMNDCRAMKVNEILTEELRAQIYTEQKSTGAAKGHRTRKARYAHDSGLRT